MIIEQDRSRRRRNGDESPETSPFCRHHPTDGHGLTPVVSHSPSRRYERKGHSTLEKRPRRTRVSCLVRLCAIVIPAQAALATETLSMSVDPSPSDVTQV